MATQNKSTGNSISANLLPAFYQTPANKKFLQATIDQLFQPGTVTKTNGFIGRENAKAATGSDIYVAAANQTRQNYQLEPGLTINDSLGNVTFFKDYQDYINQINVFGGITGNHERVNSQEFYSWDPHIDWDKIVNFQNYYWLPYGPETITIYGEQIAAHSKYTVELQSEGDTNEYLFTPDGLTLNPVLKLYRGQTYTFTINSPGNPFSFKTNRSLGAQDRYVITGIDNYGVTNGTITFTVPLNAPSLMYYQSETDINVGGAISIFNISESSGIDVENEILGKTTYTLSNGTPLSNGMKLAFAGTVTPASYATGQYYVEGVGSAIKLVLASSLEIVAPYTVNQNIEFDSVPFDNEPFEDAAGYAGEHDYITINRSSQDRNPWSRYNRWFHQSVILASAAYNGNVASLDQATRAIRPIIEFQPNLKLFNMGTVAVQDVDLVDNYTTDIFSTIEGARGYNIDQVAVTAGQRILVTADTDPAVVNNIYEVSVVNISGYDQLHLTLVDTPVVGTVTLVTSGATFQSQSFWFNGTTWLESQSKTTVNQAPKFDVFDSNGVSFSDPSVYDGTTFAGSAVFSYPGSLDPTIGIADTVLGFPLTYQNVNNIGDIVFNFNLSTDSFQYKKNNVVVAQNIDIGYLLSHDYAGNQQYVNGWQMTDIMYIQFAIRIYKNSNKTNNFDIDIFDNISELDFDSDDVRVYVNDNRVLSSNWSLVAGSVYYQVVFNTPVALTDVVTIKVHTSEPVNSNGFYEIPVNLQNNPLNSSPTSFTLGEIIDHVETIIDNVYEFDADSIGNKPIEAISNYVSGETFVGVFPGVSNLHDLGNITQYGTKFVQHSGPISLAGYHITSENNNVIAAIELNRDDYSNFKRAFIATAGSLGKDADPAIMVDLILSKLTANTPNTAPYYFSDMVPTGAKVVTDLTVVDYRIKKYPLTTAFTLTTLSNKAVGVYLNGTQLIYGKDYTFDPQGFVIVTATLANGDIISTYEYDSTDGSFVPATPTKLGMWPKYEPKIYLDTTLLTPQTMIQGHDGSLILAYGDYRDDVILELEKRIFNNIKVEYNTDIFDINSYIPGFNRGTDYSLSEFNNILAPNFYTWVKSVGVDYTKSLSFDRSNPFTFNYTSNSAPDGTSLPGYWRGVYRWLLDTDRPNICPWEMLGFSVQPNWWTSVYGPAPYTSDNLVLWNDLTNGVVREPGKPLVTLTKYARPFLANHVPVDESGNLRNPIAAGLATGVITQNTDGNFVFGDVGPVEAAWRRSSHYAFSVIKTFVLMNPANTIGVLLDKSRISRNLAGQLVYTDTGLRITPATVVVPSIHSSTSRVQTAGLINYIVEYSQHYIFSNNTNSYNAYIGNLQNLEVKLSYRVGAYTNSSQFNLLLESKSPSSTGSVFIPAEDYKIFLNSSSAITKLNYSGVMVTKLSTGYEINGYSNTQPYFYYYQYQQTGVPVNIGGISASYSAWTPGQQYIIGSIVKFANAFYETTQTHIATTTFESSNFAGLPTLPIVGGVNAIMRNIWDRSTAMILPYGTVLTEIQDVVDFLLGYGEYLKDQGFAFDTFNSNMGLVANWETSTKEFLFWTTQNWSSGSDKWTDWVPEQAVSYGSIVRYNGDYYSAIFNILPESVFDADKYTKLDGLSNIGSSVISLSPAANGLTFTTTLSVVDDISNPFNTYEIFKVDGTPIPVSNLTSYRNGNTVTYSTTTTDGIYNASFYLIQNEHVVVINNTTIFNDIIYNLESGYRRERIKISGYITNNWDGSLDIPGFIFDQATVQNWQQWQDYNMGDVIAYQGNYYSANAFIPGSSTFVASNWSLMKNKPTPNILPNWTNIATQFTDFYSLNVDSFDAAQQATAQHLVGYQKRQYLNNIIQDSVSEFKFYQGMIREKGTQNVLNKLFGVLTSDSVESLTFYEEWAIRVGQYGAAAAFENIEFILDENLFRNNPQGIALVNRTDSTLSPFTIQQTPNDVYLKPLGYNSKPFPTLAKYNPFLRTAGYVNPSDVFLKLGYISEIASHDITTFPNGAYIWCAFENTSWNVYRFTDANINVSAVSYSNGTLTLTALTIVPLTVGQYIGLAGVALLDGFYKVSSVTLNTFTISATVSGFPLTFTQASSLTVYTLLTQRAASIDDINSVIPSRLVNGDLLWTDNTAPNDGQWASWKYNAVYNKTTIVDSDPTSNLTYGRTLAITPAATMVGFSTSEGTVITHDKVGISVDWIQRQIIQAPFVATVSNANTTNELATVIAFSSDGSWMATGSPAAGYAATHYVGVYSSGNEYNEGDIVSVGTTYYKALTATVQTPSSTATQWELIPYVPTAATGTDSAYAAQGVISIYSKDANNIYTLVDTIVSPFPSAHENFGAALAFDGDTLYISAPGYNSNAGRVYVMNYTSTVNVSTSYNPIGSVAGTIVVTSTAGIRPGMFVQGTGFTSGQYVDTVVDSKTLVLSGSPDSTPNGKLQFTTVSWQYNYTNILTGTTPNGSFGGTLALSQDGSTLMVSSVGVVNVYSVSSSITLVSTITGVSATYGTSIAVSAAGEYVAVSDVIPGTTVIPPQDAVKIYARSATGTYSLYQTLTSHLPANIGRYGNKIAFMNGYTTLVVFSPDANSTVTTTFDVDSTYFDNRTTDFLATQITSGRVDIYDRYATKWVFSESLANNGIQADGYGTGFAVGLDQIFVSSPYATDKLPNSGLVFAYGKAPNSYSWTIDRTLAPVVDISKVKKAFLYNKAAGVLSKYLDVVDPLQGKIPGIAEEEITFKTFYDPAVYSVGTTTVSVNENGFWSKAQVGKIWWDLRTAKFLETNFDDIDYKNNNWNTLATGASIDIYEWVETDLMPANWDLQADTPSGLALGISGTSLYGNDSYSVVKRYDNISKTFYNTYYFWVKNKRIAPAVDGRHMSAYDVSNTISNPRTQGYTYLALTGENSFSLVNAKQYLADANIVLSLEYWLIAKTDQNVHSQWKLISNDTIVTLPKTIEQKWFDSLCGMDQGGRSVPDPLLPAKLKYGIENRPRQGMFVNRIEALKELIERVNKTIISEQITSTRDLSSLNTYDLPPAIGTGVYDTVIDTDSGLSYVNVSAVKDPVLTPVIVDGKIIGVTIVYSGAGYIVPPTITISGTGEGAILQTVIDSLGKITNVTVTNSGQGYTDATTLTARSYSVLISSDSAADGNWSIYSYNLSSQTWTRVLTQAYDVRNYWAYADWYGSYTDATGKVLFTASQFSAPDHAVSTFADLPSITDTTRVGNLVKIISANSGGWLLLYKYADSASIDWTQSYALVGIQNGTIQFDTTLYEFAGTGVGYDANSFDGQTFDVVASAELRIILNAIKKDILIGTLSQSYLDLFLASVRYAHSEQVFLDWAFKTSFIRATHNVGQLSQPINYPINNLPNFQDYVAEVKPYRTKIREYISNYTGVPQKDGVDWSYSAVTDFDMPPVYENGSITTINAQVVNGKIVAGDTNINTYPWKSWEQNVGFTVSDIKIIDGGSNYITAPIVSIISDSGSGATAQAFIVNGKVSRVVMTNPGSGYLAAPTIEFLGGLGNGESAAATATAIIENGVIRSSLIALKFDRVNQTYFISDLNNTETFTGSGSRLQYPLIWAPDVSVGKSSVLVNGVPILREFYKLSIVISTANGYTQYSGTITFTNAPALNSSIVVNYTKDVSILSATDRIQYYYNPANGDLGKDLSQLMTGVDYGGVQVSGLNFDVSAGWSELPYNTEGWDVYDENYTDYTVVVASGTHSFTLPYAPANNVAINIYHSANTVATYVSDGVTTSYNYNPEVLSPEVTVVNTILTSGSNVAGSFVLNLVSTSALAVGDVLSESGSAFTYATEIVAINSSTQVTLNQILFANISTATEITFTRTVASPNVLVSYVGLIEFANPINAGATINITGMLKSVRLDDPHYGTNAQTNSSAIMTTPVGDGTTTVFAIPNGYTVNTGDSFVLRQSTSDGSIAPQDLGYDSDITGGDLAYSTATGLNADDIVIDGDGFATPTTSPAPEEVVPGQVVDTVAIKVFDQKNSGAAQIKVDNYNADGIKHAYPITQIPNSPTAVIVKLGSVVKTNGADYTVNYRDSTIVFNTVPAANTEVTIFSLGFNGTNILDIDYFVGDGATKEFVTRAPWSTSVTSLIYVDGVATTPELFKTDATYDLAGVIGLRFSLPPAAGSLVNFIIVSGSQQTFAITKSELLAVNGSHTYTLQYPVGKALPNESNMIVRVDQTILEAANNSYFTIADNMLAYTIDPTIFLPNSVDITAITVYVSGALLNIGTDYTINLDGITININQSTYDKYEGQELIISVVTSESYTYNPVTNQITFTNSYNSPQVVEVITSYVHDVLNIERTSINVTSSLALTPDTVEYYYYKSVASGTITLNRTVISDDYVWVVKNGSLLTPSIDYRLNSDFQSITLAASLSLEDVVTFITFGNNIFTGVGIVYMQFKDMLNRTSYTRLSKSKQTTLAADLHWNDTTITLTDGTNISTPNPNLNKPGVIEIRGERIEYFSKTGNVLSKLRRGTYGTGVYSLNRAGSYVQEMGSSELIPYSDTSVTDQVVSTGKVNSDGTQTVALNFIPATVNDIEVFVGGYDTSTVWTAGTEYSVGEMITIGVYTYKCVVAHTSSTVFNNDIANWQFFIGNIRLKKSAYTMFNVNNGPYSPAGDISFPADFTVDGVSAKVTLTNPVAVGTRITVIKQTGTAWDSSVNILDDGSRIANFINAERGIWYNEYRN